MSQVNLIQNGPFSVPGVRIGHWQDNQQRTGCTVLICDEPMLAIADVRGGAPGTRETDLLQEGRLVQRVDAILLSGGSVFGLRAADGVVDWLREEGRGFPTPSIPAPIVPSAIIFDLKGDHPVWPDQSSGYAAAVHSSKEWQSGRLGAGTGATVGKVAGAENVQASGIGVARIAQGNGGTSALIVNNAFGCVLDDQTGDQLTTASGALLSDASLLKLLSLGTPDAGTNTTIGVVVLDQPMSRDDLVRLGVSAHDGLARVLRPSHTPFDGDTLFVVAPEGPKLNPSDLLWYSIATQNTVARATSNSVR